MQVLAILFVAKRIVQNRRVRTGTVRLAAVLAVLTALGLLAGCGAARKSSGSAVFQSVITRVSGTTTIVETETSDANTFQPRPAQSKVDLKTSGYLACKNVPHKLVQAAKHSQRARVRLALMLMKMLSSIAPPRDIPAMERGCLRALHLRVLLPQLVTAVAP